MSTDLTALQNRLTASRGLSKSLSLRERKQALQTQKDANILLLDISGSMLDPVSESPHSDRRIDILWTLVQKMRSQNIPFRCATFNTRCEWSDVTEKPQPYSSTDLAGAFDWLHSMATPQQITLITDGLPDNPSEALYFAQQLRCPINVLYVGPDDSSPTAQLAQAFCRQIAQVANGSYASNNLSSEMLQLTASQNMRLMLTAGAEDTNKPHQINL